MIDEPANPYLAYEITGKPLGHSTLNWQGDNAKAGFAYSPDQLNAIADSWLQLARQYKNDQLFDKRIVLQGPGADDASEGHVKALAQACQALKVALIDRETYCRNQAEKFHEAADRYAQTDHENSGRVNQAGNEDRGSYG